MQLRYAKGTASIRVQSPEIDVLAAAKTFETGYGNNRLLVHHRCGARVSSGVDFEREVMG